MPEFDLVVKDGMIVDGTRAPRFRGDIGIQNGRIAKVGRIQSHQAKKAIDASGLIVAPGFIDLHTHYDAQIFWDPYLTISGWHGITSVVIGNCGFGFAPVHPKDTDRAMLTMVRTEAIPLRSMQAAMKFDWETYPEFLNALDRQPKGVNLLPFVPMNPLLGYVMGIEESKTGRLPTDQEPRIAGQLPSLEEELFGVIQQGLAYVRACIEQAYLYRSDTPLDLGKECFDILLLPGVRRVGSRFATLRSDIFDERL